MEVYLGMIAIFGFQFNPKGWLYCAGQMLPVSSNTALFSLLGTTYGGDARTTFGLPDLRGRTAIGVGQGPGLQTYQLGQTGGFESNTLTLGQMPAHTHVATAVSTMYAEGTSANALNPKGNMLASGQQIYAGEDEQNNRAMSSQAVTTTVQVGVAGNNEQVYNMQPFLAMNYCICVEGIYPSRN